MSRIFLLPILLLAFVALFPATSAGAAPLLLSARSTACTAANASVAFQWQPMAGAQAQWLDLSVIDNGFAPGTFVGYGSIAGATGTMTWSNLQPGVPHFWRVNARTGATWSGSSTGTFVPCGGPALLPAAKISCDGGRAATVQFRWAPTSLASQTQWLDLSTADDGFAPGTFYTAGPFPADASTYSWQGLAPETQHVYRVNTLTSQGWQTSKTGTLTPCPKGAREGIEAPPAIPGPELPGERWVLVDLKKQEATAMIGDRPLFTALVTTGKDGWETPKGNFKIIYRVADETMTSVSIGAEEYYVLDHVLYTQYFTTEGHALHLNYWRDDSYFGGTPSSHGCVGMRLASAEFFWRFAGNGTRVTVI